MIARFNPLEFLQLANQLAASTDEANLRTAVNRAYYALFLLARDKLSITDTSGVHRLVVKVIKRRNNALADQLGSLKRLREVADYEPVPKKEKDRNWQRNWRVAQELAKWILPKLQALR